MQYPKAGVSIVTGGAIGKAVDASKAVENAAKTDVVQETVLQSLGKGIEGMSNLIIEDVVKDEKK